MLFPEIEKTVQSFDFNKISDDRKAVLQPLIEYIQDKVNNQEQINLNFICTHNSRRSHLSQIWAQAGDNKGVFLKMSKRKFKSDFEFSEDSFLLDNDNESSDFDRSIFVVYDKAELLDFLRLERKGTNVMLFLFDKQLFSSLSFFKEIENLVLIDGSKSRTEIFKDLALYFKSKSEFIPKISGIKFLKPYADQVQSDTLQKALFFMM
ncbi:hypothetical protein [Flavobacterium johnsoniae]|uniref:Arsenate reductase n=1 Tax=Flavobacterium johnsoniae (strain ATCC 17061 / DSM 2064 / JCM 8514 / BCRC 14874 / CCUG 350202 / NBRC 14942 / NCIMB 11054 / UW101) TaxID=376686 RepID=A5FC24_FLAJ1|nr:hypothetical protein [Flavobacterium johnsoniae]ABQ07245.1 hypothetical protein Fjoh_4237 [Flavobacterium johnsoniae UW101]OXE95866.1 hypothetical protein B0A63_23395 [Flavobacterium johnsoniae UW101]WQG80917.1 hypothetical protein SR927_23275 [Flavobacterium johnsoniae UW101]SHL25981.1 hypothetical protein SAMN05444146_3274 [Flavobacterium johnsoniae]